MKKYKVWVSIEEIDEDKDHYVPMDDDESIGPDFSTYEKAVAFKNQVISDNFYDRRIEL